MSIINRTLTVTADGEPLSFSGRIRLRGKDDLSLFPSLFTLEMWNLPEALYLRLFRAREIAVSHEGACLVSGRIRDVFRQGTEAGILTSVSVSLGLELWEAPVSVSVPSGSSVSGAVRAILSASGTGIPLLSFPDPDPVSSRGRVFFGRASECIAEALSDASCRPMLTPSGLMAVPASGPLEAVRVTAADLTDAPVFIGGVNRIGPRGMILSVAVSGWRPGQTAELDTPGVHARGIVTGRSVDADTGDGAWKCEMVLELI